MTSNACNPAHLKPALFRVDQDANAFNSLWDSSRHVWFAHNRSRKLVIAARIRVDKEVQYASCGVAVIEAGGAILKETEGAFFGIQPSEFKQNYSRVFSDGTIICRCNVPLREQIAAMKSSSEGMKARIREAMNVAVPKEPARFRLARQRSDTRLEFAMAKIDTWTSELREHANDILAEREILWTVHLEREILTSFRP